MREKFRVQWRWPMWTVGIIGPHGGMIVWILCLGPLRVEFWPKARRTSLDVVPF